ncbi:MAG: tandem-95 repeat protein, partial [Chloroflexi bacterium]|nr:tandem-95 repeat protein [Chloroflexota bacterium]
MQHTLIRFLSWRTRLRVLGVVALTLAFLLLNGAVSAATFTATESLATPVSVDNSSSFRNLAISGIPAGDYVTDVNISVTFRKINSGTCASPAAGITGANEIELRLIRPDGSDETILNQNTYSNTSTDNSIFTVVFDDEAASDVDSTPTSGTFRPAGSLALSDFDGMTAAQANGTWQLRVRDRANNKPLCYYGATLTITTAPAGVTVSPTTVNVTEGGATATYTVVLDAPPRSGPVETVTVTPGTVGGQVTFLPSSVSFTAANWNVPQTVTVTAVDDGVNELSPHTATITHTVSNSGGGSGTRRYNSVTSAASVTVNITDNDPVAPTITTQASATSIQIGQSVTDTATISSGAPVNPIAGTVNFFVCGPTASPQNCASGGTAVGSAVSVAPANGNPVTATSASFAPTARGFYCFRAEFTPAPGINYTAASHTNNVVGTNGECFELVNTPPTANNDTAAAAEDGSTGAISVLGNDNDADSDSLTITGNTQGSNGSVVCTTATCTYTPDADFFGSDSFTYTISDGNGGTATATVTITVTEVNDAPVANDDSGTTAEDTPLSGSSVLANDSRGPANESGQTLTVTAYDATSANGGTVAMNPDGTYTYTPNLNFNGSDSFTYTMCDDGTTNGVPAPLCATATVTITVTPVNDAPVATSEAHTIDEDTPLNDAVAATDVENDPLTFSVVDDVDHGTLLFNPDGSFTYTPN